MREWRERGREGAVLREGYRDGWDEKKIDGKRYKGIR